MFHRNSLRSLSLASVSDLTKAQIANYVAQYINNSNTNPAQGGQANNNGTPTHYNGARQHHRNSVGHLSHNNQAPFNVNGIDEIRSTPSFSMTSQANQFNDINKNQELEYGQYLKMPPTANAGG